MRSYRQACPGGSPGKVICQSTLTVLVSRQLRTKRSRPERGRRRQSLYRKIPTLPTGRGKGCRSSGCGAATFPTLRPRWNLACQISKPLWRLDNPWWRFSSSAAHQAFVAHRIRTATDSGRGCTFAISAPADVRHSRGSRARRPCGSVALHPFSGELLDSPPAWKSINDRNDDHQSRDERKSHAHDGRPIVRVRKSARPIRGNSEARTIMPAAQRKNVIASNLRPSVFADTSTMAKNGAPALSDRIPLRCAGSPDGPQAARRACNEETSGTPT